MPPTTRRLRSMFRGQPFELHISDIRINGMIRGCSGFLRNTDSGKICYINSEGSCLQTLANKILIRTAVNLSDYTGGQNHFVELNEIVRAAIRLTAG